MNRSYLYDSDIGNEVFQRYSNVKPLIARTVELNIAMKISSIPSPVISNNTGGVMIPLCGSVYIALD